MEADDREHAARCKLGKRRWQGALESADLVVHGDADALESARGGMDAALALGGGGNGVGDELGERGGAREGTGAVGAFDRADDAAPVVLLAEVADGPDQGIVRGLLQPAAGGLARARIHAHVGRGVGAKREAAVGLVELEGGNPEVEEDAVEAGVGQQAEVTEVQVDEAEGRRKIGAELLGASRGGGIAVEGDHGGAGFQDGAGVPAPAKRAVQVARARERREVFEHLVQHDGFVPRGHGAREKFKNGRGHGVSSTAGRSRSARAGASAGSRRKPVRVWAGAADE